MPSSSVSALDSRSILKLLLVREGRVVGTVSAKLNPRPFPERVGGVVRGVAELLSVMIRKEAAGLVEQEVVAANGGEDKDDGMDGAVVGIDEEYLSSFGG